ncbi:MAG TPA: RDD family protein [Intrasporangium sp.]|uniref:RDD family protein n=1 Tax=Intrasporangium sp. TaxID=1925024 RepID=UPI002D776B57|nr:RDD family protein [Intrasporangium sp.]HET7399006.1 RDD family protein [Intrasporangium sp.]
MSQQPSGWYDDPSNPENLRYWDGVTWTNHTAPKKSPTLSQSTIGLPQQPPGATGPEAPYAGDDRPVPSAPSGGWQGQNPSQHQQYSQYPQYPQAPQSASWMQAGATTADGVPLASWGRRFGAWILDGILISVVAGLLTQLLVPGYRRMIEEVMTAFERQNPTMMQDAVASAAGPVFLAGLVTYLTASVYAIACWTTTGQTVGKLATKISVRRADRPGPLDLPTAVRRRLLPALQLIPFFSSIYGLIALLDGLWPLWDVKRQALHDKIAGTQVVQGKQPRRQA